MPREGTKIFKALSDPGRLRILKMLEVKPMCVCEITAVLRLATSTVSKHLSILKYEGFIIERKEGKWVNYELNTNPDDERVGKILESLDFWIEEDQIVALDRENAIKANRYEICGV